jgi:hypothetical protein
MSAWLHSQLIKHRYNFIVWHCFRSMLIVLQRSTNRAVDIFKVSDLGDETGSSHIAYRPRVEAVTTVSPLHCATERYHLKPKIGSHIYIYVG